MRGYKSKSMKSKKRKLEIIGGLIAVGILLFIAVMFSSYPAGPVKKKVGEVLLDFFSITKDKRSNAELIQSMDSFDVEVQYDAVLAMAYRGYSSPNIRALINYTKAEETSVEMKDIAVWALGELRAYEARKFLLSLKVQKEIDQHEVEKAIKKIDGKISKPFWRK